MSKIKGGKGKWQGRYRKKVGLIAQAEAEYEAIVDEVWGYCQKANDSHTRILTLLECYIDFVIAIGLHDEFNDFLAKRVKSDA